MNTSTKVFRLIVGGLLVGMALVAGGGTAAALPAGVTSADVACQPPQVDPLRATAVQPCPVQTADVGVTYGPFVGYAPPGTAWGPASKSNVTVFGSKGYYQFYSWTVVPGSFTRVCAEGWTPIFGGGWYSLGCGDFGSGSLLWGTYAAVPKMRFRSTTLTGGFVYWSH